MVAFTPRRAAAALLILGLGQALGTGEVRAADLLPPPPPEAAPVAVGSGWYLRADLTESVYGRPSDNTRADANDPGMPPLVGLRLSEATGYGGGVGYHVTDWLRVDATVDDRGPGRYRAYSSRSNFTTGSNIEAAHVSALTGLVNVYADLGTWWGLTPYVGGGVGFSDMGVSHGYTQTTCVVEACDGIDGAGARTAVKRPNRSVAALAWALSAGLSYALGGGFSLDAAYRYVEFGPAKSGLDSYSSGTRLKDIAANEFRVGLRYDLGDRFGTLPNLIGVGGSAYGN
ncbi:outer membrane protein [uncultured Methylobacterium sp.]|uniref:outer membrane protein n=1 Tax=uncultured Methylobacterium sp. TaxID=157278 RepID=UPI0035C9E677